MGINIREATESDLPGMLALIRELAEYEKAPGAVMVTLEDFIRYYREKRFMAYVAVDPKEKVQGMALFYWAYSTWKGKMIYLDDMVVTQPARRSGIGHRLFTRVVEYCRENGARQLRWHVLDWNEPAIAFYRKWNADLDPEWITCKLEADQLNNL